MNDHEKTDEILDALLESYSGPAEVNNLETYRLPNRREIILAFGHIQHLLFLGYFSTRCLDDVNLRGALAEHLLPAHHTLLEQIGPSTRWHDPNKPAEERRGD